MSKICVFCGQKPEDKNMEHVIPQWLIKMTGDKKRMCHLKTIAEHDIPFIHFKFPACEACNSEFSDLEGQVKDVITKILANQPVNALEISLLLDWFDKVRIGLWLGALYLRKEMDLIEPHMHIKTRMGLKDRMLIIERRDVKDQGLAFVGPAQQTFLLNPCAFQLLINDYVFTNASEYGLVSRRLGFPYCNKAKFYDTDKVVLDDYQKSTGRVVNPVLKGFESSADRTYIYQSCSPAQAQMYPDLYKDKFVVEHSLDASAGLGGIFYQKNSPNAMYLPAGASVNLTPKFMARPIGDSVAQVFKLQNYIIDNTYTLKFAEPHIKQIQEQINTFLKTRNSFHIKQCQKLM